LAYLVKDTFEYTGDLQFDTLDDFVAHFYGGAVGDLQTLLESRTDAETAAICLQLYTNIVEHNWDAATNTYTRTLSFPSQADYLACRAAISSISWASDIILSQFTPTAIGYIKTTEILEE
jgi:hypothetical protein